MPNWNKVNNDNDNNNNDNVEVTEFAFCCVFHTLRSGIRNTPFSKNWEMGALNYATGLRNHNKRGFLWKQKKVELYAVSKNVHKLAM